MARLGIIGTGMIGGSIGMAARARGWEVRGYDRDPVVARCAIDLHAIDRNAERDDIYESCDVVAIAAHVDATVEEVRSLHGRTFRADQLVIDVASVKEPIAFAASGIDAFVPTHPMAGSERSGPTGARADMFEGRTWCYIPVRDTARTERACAFITELGARAVAIRDAEEHDRIVALTSHLPQRIAYAFTELVDELARRDPAAVDALCGPVARELLRIGRSSMAMWSDIFAANEENIERAFERLTEVLDDRRFSG
jgi:prephenate dehydrogenase